ncbi:MAG: NAD(P)H-dependent oxidoreductase subunit E [bacterium]
MNTATTQAKGLQKLTPELKAFLAESRNKPENLVRVLRRVQQGLGYIPREAAFAVADLLAVPLAQIYDVITFYNFFKLKKQGRNQIRICMGTACSLKGGEAIIHEIESVLGVGVNTVTPDGEFSFEAVRCIGCCGLAPMMVINGKVYSKVKTDRLQGVIAKFRK